MKKFLLALFVSVLSLTAAIGLSANAEEKTIEEQNKEKYTWFADYEEAGKTVWYTKNSDGDVVGVDRYGYSGVDVIMGDQVLPVYAWNILKPGEDMAVPEKASPSLTALYYNNTENEWHIPRLREAAYAVMIVDAEGRVIAYKNSVHALEVEGHTAEEGEYLSLWWDFDEEKVVSRSTENLKLQYKEDIHLTYGDLGTTYPWLTKEDVDAKKVEGETFADADKLYLTEDGKYTKVADGNEAVMNDYQGFVIPAGGFAVAFQYLENVNFSNEVKGLGNLVNGKKDAVTIVERDITAPVISGALSGTQLVREGEAFDLPTVTAKDAGAPLNGESVDVDVETVIYKYDRNRKTFEPQLPDPNNPEVIEYEVQDGETGWGISQKFKTTVAKLEELNPGINWGNLQPGHKLNVPNPDYVEPKDTKVDKITTDLVGDRFLVVHTAEDKEGNVAKISYEVHIISSFAPIINGVKDIAVSQGTEVNLLDGVTATDGYGFDITDEIEVFGHVDINKVGVYLVVYQVRNAYNHLTIETATVTIMDNEAPRVLPIQDIVIEQGTDFDLESVIVAFDNADDAEDLVITLITNDFFDKDTPGTYEIKYLVSDSSGNETEVSYNITVLGEDEVPAKSGDHDALEDALSDLEAKVDKLTDELSSKDTTLMVISIIAGVLALTGIGLGVPSLIKKR